MSNKDKIKKRYKVFFSSTIKDKQAIRGFIRDKYISDNLVEPILSEYADTCPKTIKVMDAFEASKELVKLADIFVLIIGKKYGEIKPGSSISITEAEYDVALEKEIPQIRFIESEVIPNYNVYNQYEANQKDVKTAFLEKLKKLDYDEPQKLMEFIKKIAKLRIPPRDNWRHEFDEKEPGQFLKSLDFQIKDKITQLIGKNEIVENSKINNKNENLDQDSLQSILSAFNQFNFNVCLQSSRPEPFRLDGPKIPDFEKPSWVYKPSIIKSISQSVHEGKATIIKGLPATGKSVITRYIGYDSMKDLGNTVYYIDFTHPEVKNKIKYILDSLNRLINSSEFNISSKKDILFIFENIHEPSLDYEQFIGDLRLLIKGVKILITSRREIKLDLSNEEKIFNLDENLDLNHEIIEGILKNFNKDRVNKSIWELRDKLENLWLLGWSIKLIYYSNDEKLTIQALFDKNLETNPEILIPLLNNYYKQKFPEYKPDYIIKFLLIISTTSKYEIYIEKKFIEKYDIIRPFNLRKEDIEKISILLINTEEILYKKDKYGEAFEYCIPHIKLTEIFQKYYADLDMRKKLDKILDKYIEKGNNKQDLGHNLWRVQDFYRALRCFKLNTKENKALQNLIELYNFDIKIQNNFIRHLDFSRRNNKFSNIPQELNEFSRLEILILRGCGIKKINGLANLQQLKKLDLGQNYIEKIEGLDNLSELEILYLDWNKIVRIEGLEKLGKLKFLFLRHNEIKKLEGLQNNIDLRQLYLFQNKIEKIEGLEKTRLLDTLWLNDNNIETITGLEYLLNLRELSLGDNQIRQINGVSSLLKLKNLNLSHNIITKIENLDDLIQLDILQIMENNITKIEGFRRLYNLQELWLYNNKITKIENLENLKILKYLSLGSNNIQKIEGLENLSQLQYLYLSYNQIGKIENLENLLQLNTLFLNNNEIERIEGLENLKQLEELFLNRNNIQRIEKLENLTQLKHLSLSNNRITKIEGLNNLNNLKKINLYGNIIPNFDIEKYMEENNLEIIHGG